LGSIGGSLRDFGAQTHLDVEKDWCWCYKTKMSEDALLEVEQLSHPRVR